MEYQNIFIPLILLVLTFVVKLAVEGELDARKGICALCELPIDMIFLSISFLLAIVMSNGANRDQLLFCVFAFIVFAVIAVILTRKSVKIFEAQTTKWWILMLVSNLVISISCLVWSVMMISDLYPIGNNSNSKTNTKTEVTDGKH